MSTVIGVLVFLILLAIVLYLWRMNDQGRPPV
jgi:hypothetical protein